MSSFGIDIATSQNGLDLVRAKAAGVQFVIVKLGGANTGELYVAPFYIAEVERAITAGFKAAKGHYWVVGSRQTPAEQGTYFAQHLHAYDPKTDILALDNEKLDAAPIFWNDDQVAEFWAAVVRVVTVRAGAQWQYSPAALTRGGTPWTKLNAAIAAGVRRIWWASYGGQPTGRTPDHTPDLQGAVSGWSIHQYTDRVAVNGSSLDGDYSPLSIAQLFGGTVTQVIKKVTPTPKPGPSATTSKLALGHGTATGLDHAGWLRAQTYLSKHYGYTGKLDGAPGTLTYEAFARFLNSLSCSLAKTTTTTDGKPGDLFYKRLQFLASKNGYTGPLDGAPALQSWTGVAAFFNKAI